MYVCSVSKSILVLFILQDTKRLTVTNVRTMKMNDDVLVVAASPDAKYIAVALLDCTVKVGSTQLYAFFIFFHYLAQLIIEESL